MNRRTLAAAMLAVAFLHRAHAQAEEIGVKIRFVVTRLTLQKDGTQTRTTYENAVLVAKGEKVRFEVPAEYVISFRPVPTDAGVRIEASVQDLNSEGSSEMSGNCVVQVGAGGAIALGTFGSRTYLLGLLATTQALPKHAA